MPRHNFEDVLGTNYIPTHEEVRTIKNIISKPLLQIAKLDEEIFAAEKRLHDLRQTRTNLLGGIEAYHQLISPVRRLPTDIVREIFIKSLPEDRNPTMSADEAPVVLTRISSHWRTIALTTPRLWAALHIPVPNSDNAAEASFDPQSGKCTSLSQIVETRLAATTEWIKKSGALPLSFSLHNDSFLPHDFCKKFIQLILPYRARWKSLDLNCDASSFLDIHNLPPAEVPLLQSLSLVIFHPELVGPSMPHWKDMPIFKAPAVRKISVAGMVTGIYGFPFAWSKLTDLDIKGSAWSSSSVFSANDLASTLTQCPNLISLTCSIHEPPQDYELQHTPFPTISLPYLESLSFFDDAGGVSALYTAIDAPKVRKLNYRGLRGVRRSSNATTFPFYQLLARIGSSLEELAVTSAAFEGYDEVVAGLAVCPSLKSLSITSSPNVPLALSMSRDKHDPPTAGNGFLESLAHISDVTPPVCPRLEVLKCRCNVAFTEQALVNLVLCKQSGEHHGLAPLKLVDVFFMCRETVDVPALLSHHIAAGLDLKLQYLPCTYRGPFSLFRGLPRLSDKDPYLQTY